MSDLVLIEMHGGVQLVKLNRPSKRNALNRTMQLQVLKALEVAEDDSAVRCVLIAAEGTVFCAGADLVEIREAAQDPVSRRTRIETAIRLQLAASRLQKPVVAAVQGAAVGAGAGLAISADVVILADDAVLSYPEVPHGMVPYGMMPMLVRQLGRRLAFETIALGTPMNAEQSVEAGLANRVVPRDQLLDEGLRFAQQFAAMDPAVLARTKRLFCRIADLSLEEAVAEGLLESVSGGPSPR